MHTHTHAYMHVCAHTHAHSTETGKYMQHHMHTVLVVTDRACTGDLACGALRAATVLKQSLDDLVPCRALACSV
jgi:hypothetical protein